MSAAAREGVKALGQVAGILAGVLILSMVLHKGYVDIAALAEQHSGAKFWLELARYFIGNIAGGGSRAPADS